MPLHPLAGKPAPPGALIDVAKLEREFLSRRPDPSNPRERVKFGTSGHRGTPLDGSLTAAHILAITQAICDYRRANAIDGPLYMGKDTHALSSLSQDAALEVLAANSVETIVQRDDGVHADAGCVPRRHRTQPWPLVAPRRRHRHHAVAQSARGRRLQVQPAERRARRHGRHAVDSGPRQRAAGSQESRRQARIVDDGAEGIDDARGRSRSARTSTT